MPEYQRWKNIMKCYPFEEKRLAKWSPPYICQPKYDGDRCRAIPLQTGINGDEYLLVSSEENVIFSVPHINAEFSRLKLNAELDGELYCHGMNHEQIHGIVSRTVNFHQDSRMIQFHLFDIINDQPQMKRTLIIENLRGLSPWIIVSPFYMCETLDDVLRAYDKIIEAGYEGIIVRECHSPYVRKRSTQVMKFKPKQEDTYQIIDMVEEVDIYGKPKDSLGSLTCLSGEAGGLDLEGKSIAIDYRKMIAIIDGITYNIFSVGTGYSKDQRHELWSLRRFQIVGMKAKVKYQHITSGNKVPRFPVFVEVTK